MRKPEENSDLKVVALAVLLGGGAFLGVGKFVVDRVTEALGGISFKIEEEPHEERPDSGFVVGEARVSQWPAAAAAAEERQDPRLADLEAANELIYAVEIACDTPHPNPLEYDEDSKAERDACNLMQTTTEYSLCMDDLSETLCAVEQPENMPDMVMNCLNYNPGSPREACLDDLQLETRERIFYECRDSYLEERDIVDVYYQAQTKVLGENMKYIGGLLEKLNDPNYKPSKTELLNYFTAYNQIRTLRDFDMVLDQLELADRTEFAQIYGKDVKEIILARGCSDAEEDLIRMLEEFLPT